MKIQLLQESVSILIQLHQELKANQTISSEVAQHLIGVALQIEGIQKTELNNPKYQDYSKDENVKRRIKYIKPQQPVTSLQSAQCKEILSPECLQEVQMSLNQRIFPFLNLDDLRKFRCVNSSINSSILSYLKQRLPKEEKQLAHHLFSSYYLSEFKFYLFQHFPLKKWFIFDYSIAQGNVKKYRKDFERLKKIHIIPQQYEKIIKTIVLLFTGELKKTDNLIDQFKRINSQNNLKQQNIEFSLDQLDNIDIQFTKRLSLELHNTVQLCYSLVSLHYLENIFEIGSKSENSQNTYQQISTYYWHNFRLINWWKHLLNQSQKFQLFLDFTIFQENSNLQNNSCSSSNTSKFLEVLSYVLEFTNDLTLLKCRLINKKAKEICHSILRKKLIFNIYCFESEKLQYQENPQQNNGLGFFNPIFDMTYTILIEKYKDLIQFNQYQQIKQCDDEFVFYVNTAFQQLHGMQNIKTLLTKTTLLRTIRMYLNPFNKSLASLQLADHALSNLYKLVENNQKISYNFEIIYPLFLYLKLFIIINRTLLPISYEDNIQIQQRYQQCLRYLTILFQIKELGSSSMRDIVNEALQYFSQEQKMQLASQLHQDYFTIYAQFPESLESYNSVLELLTQIISRFDSMNIYNQEQNYRKSQELNNDHEISKPNLKFSLDSDFFIKQILYCLNYSELIDFACVNSVASKTYQLHLKSRISYESKLIKHFEQQNKVLLEQIQSQRKRKIYLTQKDKALELVQQFSYSDFTELRSILHPSETFDAYSKPFLILFGLNSSGFTSNWSVLRSFLSQQNAYTIISEIAPEIISRQTINQIKDIVEDCYFNLEQLPKISTSLLKFINWLKGVLILHQYLRKYSLMASESGLTEEHRNLFYLLDMKQTILYKAMRYINQYQ